MTAWGVVAVCAIGGGVAGPLLDGMARRVRPAPGAGSASLHAHVATPAAAPAATFAPDATPAPVHPHQGTAAAEGPGAAAEGPGAASEGPGPASERPGAAAPTVEIAVVTVVAAGACALAAVRLGAVPSLAAFCALFGGLVAMSAADLRTGLVPRRFLYPTLGLVAAGLVAASADAGQWRPLLDGAIGGAVAFVVFYAVWWVYPKGLGFGDVRLAGLCGSALGFLGFRQLYLGFLAAFLFGALGGLLVLARRGSHRFPFAPALAAGTAFGVLWGGWLGNLWLHPG